MKLGKIELFTDDVMEVINQQEYIGIRMSSGIDSAILCHIVLKYFPHIKLMPITFYNKVRPGAIVSMGNVLKVLNELNPNNNLMTQEIGIFETSGFSKPDIPFDNIKRNPKDIFQKQFITDLFDRHNGKLNVILSGETLNPPIEDQIAMGQETEFPEDRNRTRADLLAVYDHNGTTKYEYRPFRNNNKREIADICRELNLMGSLFPVTETCETEPANYKKRLPELYGMTYTAPGIEPCQCCWACREKFWAYGVYDFNTPSRVQTIKPYSKEYRDEMKKLRKKKK